MNQEGHLKALLEANERSILTVDTDRRMRFSADFSNRADLERALERLARDERWHPLVATHRGATLETYERVFGHHAYAGRSGSMYGYEGIGSIYWHMVAKLLVAVQGSVLDAVRDGASAETTDRLIDGYWRVRSGLGFNKTAEQFGAMPLDPYSHTPAHAGAQQPGMTGLVKEELLTRPLETGVRVESGEIHIDPILLREEELLKSRVAWTVHGIDQEPHDIELAKGSLGMTLCQVPVVVSMTAGEPMIEVVRSDGTTRRTPGLTLDGTVSAEVFARSGIVEKIIGHVPSELI